MTSNPVAVDVSSMMPIDAAKNNGGDDDDDSGGGSSDDDDGDDPFVMEMLAVAKAMTAADPVMAGRLVKALRTMDNTERGVADLSDQTFYAYLKLYPAWQSYAEDADPVARARKFSEYSALLDAYNNTQKTLIDAMGMLKGMQIVLLPSNVLPDPDRRILPEVNIANVLEALNK